MQTALLFIIAVVVFIDTAKFSFILFRPATYFPLKQVCISDFLCTFVPDSGSPVEGEWVGHIDKRTFTKRYLWLPNLASSQPKRYATERPRWVYCIQYNISRRGLTRVAYPWVKAMRGPGSRISGK